MRVINSKWSVKNIRTRSRSTIYSLAGHEWTILIYDQTNFCWTWLKLSNLIYCKSAPLYIVFFWELPIKYLDNFIETNIWNWFFASTFPIYFSFASSNVHLWWSTLSMEYLKICSHAAPVEDQAHFERILTNSIIRSRRPCLRFVASVTISPLLANKIWRSRIRILLLKKFDKKKDHCVIHIAIDNILNGKFIKKKCFILKTEKIYIIYNLITLHFFK